MLSSRRVFLRTASAAITGAALAGSWAPLRSAAQTLPSHPAAQDPVIHLLNRLTYGPRPEDIRYVRQIGIQAYLDEQLAPDSIDDSVSDDLLRAKPILFMSRKDLHRLGFDGRVHHSLITGMILRAVHSRRQLLERMVEFWTDHFNIPSDDLAHDLLLMHREVIRKHALGNFRDLVLGTAQSPAMLYYLDQTYSTKEHPNENYARELMELHTLGVDGGYNEADVREAARVLTGWTVHNGTSTGFYFDASLHDIDVKTVLGHRMPEDRGIEDGLHLISILVNHPSTAHFLCHKLCVRFVSDDPPSSLVQSSAQVWRANDGAIVPVLRHIFQSPEFLNSAGQKLRRPLDFFIGAVRTTGTSFRNEWLIHEMLEDLGQVPYGWKPPNGYPDTVAAWLSSAGLLARWNVAMLLSHDAYSLPDSGMDSHLERLIDQPQTAAQLVQQVSLQVFGTELPEDQAAPFVDFVSDGAGGAQPLDAWRLSNKLGMLFGLMLASPLYQWR